MKRRTLLVAAGATLANPSALLGQAPGRVYRIAIFDDSVEGARAEYWKTFRDRIRELGLVEAKDVTYVTRYARGDTERLPALAAELVGLKPDIIVCAGTATTGAAIKATSSIPIVFAGAGDPVGTGLVASLAHPGGNVTGISTITPAIGGKLVELLREIAPGVTRLAYLTDASNKSAQLAGREVERQAHAMNLAVRLLDGRMRTELERSFETIKREQVQGFIVGSAGVLMEHRDRIVQFAALEKLPVAYGRHEYVVAGGLLSYSVDLQFAYLRGAEYALRILKGTKPADLPVDQANTLRMVLNLKTARALGIKIPGPLRMRADEVIE